LIGIFHQRIEYPERTTNGGIDKKLPKYIEDRRKNIKKVTEALLNFLGFQNKDLSVLFVDNKKITLMNKKFFGKNNPTNVISFPTSMVCPMKCLVISLFSLEKAEEEAQASGTFFYERFFALIVHGLTHIMGYDHEKDESERRNEAQRKKAYRFCDGQ